MDAHVNSLHEETNGDTLALNPGSGCAALLESLVAMVTDVTTALTAGICDDKHSFNCCVRQGKLLASGIYDWPVWQTKLISTVYVWVLWRGGTNANFRFLKARCDIGTPYGARCSLGENRRAGKEILKGKQHQCCFCEACLMNRWQQVVNSTDNDGGG